MEKKPMDAKTKKGCFGCLAILAVIFIAVVIIISISINNTTKEEELTTKEQAKITKTINDFEKASELVVNTSKGIVKKIEMSDVKKEDYFVVHVYVAETNWANSNESEKASFATTVATSLESLATPTKIYVYVISATNGDVLASPKITSTGYNIKR